MESPPLFRYIKRTQYVLYADCSLLIRDMKKGKCVCIIMDSLHAACQQQRKWRDRQTYGKWDIIRANRFSVFKNTTPISELSAFYLRRSTTQVYGLKIRCCCCPRHFLWFVKLPPWSGCFWKQVQTRASGRGRAASGRAADGRPVQRIRSTLM